MEGTSMVKSGIDWELAHRVREKPAVTAYLGSLGRVSQDAMRQALNLAADIVFEERGLEIPLTDKGKPDPYRCKLFDWALIRWDHVEAIKVRLRDAKRAPATTNKVLTALRGVAKAAWRLEQMSTDDYMKIKQVEGVNGKRLPTGRHIPDGELLALMQACARDEGPAGTRDAAIIGSLSCTGMRRAELLALDMEDYDPGNDRLATLRVLGKGDKERWSYLANGAKDALDDWLLLRGDSPGAIFWPINKGGRLLPGRLTDAAVNKILEKRRGEAGIGEALTPHDFRRSFIGNMLDLGADIVTVQALVGHSSPTTTARYDRRPEEARKKAVERLHVPYIRKSLDLR